MKKTDIRLATAILLTSCVNVTENELATMECAMKDMAKECFINSSLEDIV